MAIFFDTHAHIDYPEYEPDLPAVIERARLAGIRTGLISNSWVPRHYDRELLSELFEL